MDIVDYQTHLKSRNTVVTIWFNHYNEYVAFNTGPSDYNVIKIFKYATSSSPVLELKGEEFDNLILMFKGTADDKNLAIGIISNNYGKNLK